MVVSTSGVFLSFPLQKRFAMAGSDTPTPAPLSSTMSTLRHFASVTRDAMFLASLVVSISMFLGAFAMKMLWPIFIDRLAEDLNVVTREDLMRLEQQLNQVTGEDRLIRMPSGHSFVREPVRQGARVQLTLVIGKTHKGLACNLLEITPIYTDERVIPLAGKTLPPVAQLQLEPRRFQLELEQPLGLEPGRTALSLGLKFACPFGAVEDYIDVYEETQAVFFQLDP